MRYARVVCCQFASTAEQVAPEHRGKLRVTGCPIRREIRDLPPRRDAAGRLGIDPMLHTLVITGASQGAVTVNEAMLALAGTIRLEGWQILHLSGREHGEMVRNGYRQKNVPAHVIDFTPAMQDVWAVADLALSRSGASSCAELTACGVPSVLVPYPFHKDLHQRANAKALADGGAAILMDDEKAAAANAQKLRPILEALLYDAPKRKAMSQAARKLSRPDAAEIIAGVISEMIK
jgi:UDP-N-acetylglucosamine--N-acetylmuramyl-(pentapeptide) pyrophosphoryl-undecaprenol N-acetylglucosamine transferase